nr:MAG TPA: Glucose-regulated metallo-peptidase M90 [Caudoviricetes sp.]
MEYRQNSWDNKPTDENGEETKGVNHGNTGLPFGLCAKYGIRLPKNATPSDAWDALEGKDIYPPWTDKGKASGMYKDSGEEKKAEPIQWSDNIEDYGIDIQKTSKTPEEFMKMTAEAIKGVCEQYPLDKFKRINFANRGKKYNASANGISLNITANWLQEVMANPNRNYENNQRWYDVRQAAHDRALRYAEEATTESEKKIRMDAAAREIAFKRWTVEYPNASLQTTLYHELGHALADQYFGQINRNLKIDGKSELSYEEATRIVKKAYRESIQNKEIHKISRYALEDYQEFFAECFVVKMCGYEELPPTVAKMFKELKL